MAKKAIEAADFLKTLFYTCFQTGSRRFGYDTPTSDWDFATDAAEGTLPIWLRMSGFKKVGEKYGGAKWDEDTQEVWELKDETGTVQVVFSRNFARKRKIFEWLDKKPDIVEKYYQVPKNERNKIWTFLHKKAEQGELK